MPEMTPLQNNPPQSLAQPMRQAYDYWQEVPCHKRKKPKKASLFAAKLSTTQERICKAPCAWRVPPPSRGSSPLLPVCKSYQRRKKRPSRGVYPPHAGQVPAITRMQKLSTVRETPLRALFRGFRVYISIDKGQYCPRTTPSGWTAGHSLLVLLQSWHMPAAR